MQSSWEGLESPTSIKSEVSEGGEELKRLLLLFREAFRPLIMAEYQSMKGSGNEFADGSDKHCRDAIHLELFQSEGTCRHYSATCHL